MTAAVPTATYAAARERDREYHRAPRTVIAVPAFRVRPTADIKLDADANGFVRRVLVRDLAPVRVAAEVVS